MATQGMTQFPGGFATGLSVRGMPLLQTQPGKVFWVSNATTLVVGQKNGSDQNKGTYDAPFATIYYAISQCTASRGDIIFVKPGHAETISSAAILLLDVAGVAIVGLGSGSLRPTLTFTTATTANIPLVAANCSIQNFLFKANFANIASVFTATSTNTPTDTAIENCEFRDGSSSLNFVSIVTGNATANSNDGLAFTRNRISSLATTAATTPIKCSSAQDRMIIQDNFFVGAVLNDTAMLLAMGANVATNLDMGRNKMTRPNTSSTGGMMFSGGGTASSGILYDNYCWHLASSGLLAPTLTKLAFVQNFCSITGAADKSPLINPAAV